MSISDRLISVLKEKDLTAYRLSKLSGVTEMQIGRILKSANTPNDSTLKAIANSIDIDFDYLKNGTIKPEPSNNEPQNNENPVNSVTQIKMNVQVINHLSNMIDIRDKEIEVLRRELKECKESERVNPL